jgi:hypothetical protein
LIAGAPAEMWEKVPQAVNLNTWPATLFVGRDGRVKHIHAGFAAPASGVRRSRAIHPTTPGVQQTSDGWDYDRLEEFDSSGPLNRGGEDK